MTRPGKKCPNKGCPAYSVIYVREYTYCIDCGVPLIREDEFICLDCGKPPRGAKSNYCGYCGHRHKN